MKTFLFVFAALVLGACSPGGSDSNHSVTSVDSAQSDIINGRLVQPNDPVAASTVSLLTRYPIQGQPGQYRMSLCSGSLIGPNLVLTAAHCVYGAQLNAIYILFGTNVARTFETGGLSPDMYRTVTKFVVHGYYGKNQDNAKNFYDIAMVEFSGPVAQGYRSASFIANDSLVRDAMPVLVAGFGRNDGTAISQQDRNPADLQGAGILREVMIPIKTYHWSDHEFLTNKTNPTYSPCDGDSGGPVFAIQNQQPLLLGLVSRGVVDPINGDGATSTNTTINNCDQYAAYTNVLDYKSWILEKIRTINDPHTQANSTDDGGASQDPNSVYGAHRKTF